MITTEIIKTFEDVLNYHGIKQEDFQISTRNLSKDEIAYKKLKLIAEALNGDWKPDYSDASQIKYEPLFGWSSSVGGFSYDGYDDWSTNTTVGSRLCFKSKQLAKYAGTQFLAEYNEFLSL